MPTGLLSPVERGGHELSQCRGSVPPTRARPAATDQGLKRIKVSVTSPGGRVTTLEALRSAENGYEHTPGSQATYTCHVGVSIQIGTNTVVRNVQGVALNNLVP